MVLPVTAARWSAFQHKSVPSAATFFGASMFSLSGAINVSLFMLVRPRLLLFNPPEEPSRVRVELGHSGSTSSAMILGGSKYNINHLPTSTDDMGERARD
jgi:hypothetical protein